MSQTQAITAVFPPGRYGRRREPRRTPRWVTAALLAATVVAAFGVTWLLYRQYGDPAYRAQVTKMTEVTTDGVTIEFTVTVPTGGQAICTVHARSPDRTEVGRAEVTVAADAGERQTRTMYRLATSGQPATAEVSCRPDSR